MDVVPEDVDPDDKLRSDPGSEGLDSSETGGGGIPGCAMMSCSKDNMTGDNGFGTVCIGLKAPL